MFCPPTRRLIYGESHRVQKIAYSSFPRPSGCTSACKNRKIYAVRDRDISSECRRQKFLVTTCRLPIMLIHGTYWDATARSVGIQSDEYCSSARGAVYQSENTLLRGRREAWNDGDCRQISQFNRGRIQGAGVGVGLRSVASLDLPWAGKSSPEAPRFRPCARPSTESDGHSSTSSPSPIISPSSS